MKGKTKPQAIHFSSVSHDLLYSSLNQCFNHNFLCFEKLGQGEEMELVSCVTAWQAEVLVCFSRTNI